MKPRGKASFNYVLYQYTRNARVLNRDFTLTRIEFGEITSSDCFYCGARPSAICIRKNRKFNGYYIHNGIDRLDNSKGYTKENSVPCCFRCNRMKSDSSLNEFLEQVRKIYSHFDGRN